MGKKKPRKMSVSDAGELISMTGYGKSAINFQGVQLEVEIKSLNHRFFDLACRLPRSYSSFEPELRAQVNSRLERGRVELYVTRRVTAYRPAALHFDSALFDALFKVYKRALARTAGRKGTASKGNGANAEALLALDLLRRPEVLALAAENDDACSEKRRLMAALNRALDLLCAMRLKEGQSLRRDLDRRLERLGGFVRRVAALVQASSGDIRARLIERIKKLAPEVTIDQTRLASEAALLAERMDVSEELTRLASHLKQFSDTLKMNPSGRKFDFLLQEMSREVNTIGSKAQDADVQSCVIEAKLELEKMREQVQNIQ